MTSPSGTITHVSDTALMVAACRARESALEDAYFHDPFAARLAGERGMAILDALPHAGVMQLGLAIRTRFIDELVFAVLKAHPIATVLSVGCGLDTRPWRLDLPAQLRWVEVDFPAMLDYKDGMMAVETPRCRRERLSMDLNDPAQRRTLYDAAGSQPALMITEGLLLYLPAATVNALAAEVSAATGVRHWISDITTSEFHAVLSGDGSTTLKAIRHVQAPDALAGEEILEALHREGWNALFRRSYVTDVGFVLDRIRRSMGGAQPPQLPFPPEDPTGVHCFEHAA